MQNAPHQVVFVQVIMKYNLQIEKELSILVPVRSFAAFNNFFFISYQDRKELSMVDYDFNILWTKDLLNVKKNNSWPGLSSNIAGTLTDLKIAQNNEILVLHRSGKVRLYRFPAEI